MNTPLHRLYKTKLALLALVCLVSGAFLLAASQWATGQTAWAWLASMPAGEIGSALFTTGAQLVSATENIDETPPGKLLHGIMATIAEFYSSNLATESKKGCVRRPSAAGRQEWPRSAT